MLATPRYYSGLNCRRFTCSYNRVEVCIGGLRDEDGVRECEAVMSEVGINLDAGIGSRVCAQEEEGPEVRQN